MDLLNLTSRESKNLVTRDGRPAKILDTFPDGKVLIKAVKEPLPYRVNQNGIWSANGNRSKHDILISQEKKIVIHVYPNGRARWYYEGEKVIKPSRKVELLSTIKSEI